MPALFDENTYKKAVNERVAQVLIAFLKKENMWENVALYYNDKRVSPRVTTEGVYVNGLIEYANPKTITVVCEGKLYEAINGYLDAESNRIFIALNNLFEQYGFYMEFGHDWNFALYE